VQSDRWYETDLEKLALWKPLHNLLQCPNTTDSLKMRTLWVIGTALQNNPAAQLAVCPPSLDALCSLTNGTMFLITVSRPRPPSHTPQISIPHIKLCRNPFTSSIRAFRPPEIERCCCTTNECGGWVERVEDVSGRCVFSQCLPLL
jgi:hypothetical protein